MRWFEAHGVPNLSRPSSRYEGAMSNSFFISEGEQFVPQVHATGPWSAEYLHGGPPCALVTRGFERTLPDDFQLARVTFELLRPVGFAPLTLKLEVGTEGANARRGTAVLEAEGKPLIRAHMLAFKQVAVEVNLPLEAPPPLPAGLEPYELPFLTSETGYQSSMELRFARGAPGDSPVSVWLRMKVPLLPGEKPSPFVRAVCAADSGNGVAQVVDFDKFTFVNADLNLSFLRRPKGEWICLEAHTMATKDGVGFSDTRLWDEKGPIGRGTQSLLVRPRVSVG
jgi:hypothetical protein